MTSTARRPQTSAPGDGSRTITVHDSQPLPEINPDSPPENTGILKLRGGPRSRPRVMWDADVIDNEGCGRKKSKICCIYHKPKAFDESSDESSDDSDASCGSNDSRRPRRNHSHNHGGESSATRSNGSPSNTVTFHPDPGPNAYEKSTSGSKGKQKGASTRIDKNARARAYNETFATPGTFGGYLKTWAPRDYHGGYNDLCILAIDHTEAGVKAVREAVLCFKPINLALWGTHKQMHE